MNKLAGNGIFVDALGEDQAQVHADQGDDEAGNDEDMQGEEAGQSFARYDGPGEQQMNQLGAN